MNQYKSAIPKNIQPADASTKELVAVRLIIGVILARSSAKPATSAATAAPNNIDSFFLEDIPLSTSNFPASTPQIVCAAVGMKLNATQPSVLILPIITTSI